MVIVCPNLKDKNVAAEFNEIVQAVGEDAAYLIWSLNNGNSIDKAPNGADSILFDRLLLRHNGNRLAAIKDKAMTFADNYTKLRLDDNGEVLIEDLYSGIDTNQPNFETADLSDRINNDFSSYVRRVLASHMQSAQNVTNPLITLIELAAAKEWVDKEQARIINETQLKLIEAFGMTYENGLLVIRDDSSETARLRILFVKGLKESGHIDTFLRNEIDHYIIQIGMSRGDATTFNHELAHYYIRRFRDSKLVLTALDEYAKRGMTIDQIEESLVDAITKRSIENEWGDGLENLSFFHKFWYGFNNLLYNVFNIKNKTHKNYITEQITKSFLVNKLLDLTLNDSKYQLGYERMYQSEYKSRIELNSKQSYKSMIDDNIDRLRGNIINSTRSKEKSYKQRLRRNSINSSYNIELSTRNQEMSRKTEEYRKKILEAQKNKDVAAERSHTINMIFDFIKNADIEISQMRYMMMNAKANEYKNVFYKNNPNGTISYSDNDNVLYTNENPEEGIMSHEYTFDDLEYAKTDIVGFFGPIISLIYNDLDQLEALGYDSDIVLEIREFLQQKNLIGRVHEILDTWQNALEKKVLDSIDRIVEDRVELDDDRKQRLRINMHKWLRDQMDYGDVKAAEIVIGMGSRSKSPIVRAVLNIIDQMEDEKGDKTYKRAMELMELKRKAEKSMGKKYKFFYNVQKLLMQMDERGLPTGYLVSKINTALYYRDREKFRDLLLFGSTPDSSWQFNNKSIEQQIRDITNPDGTKLVSNAWSLMIDSDGHLILPEHPKCDEIYKNYMKEYESWMCDHVERPYTKKYYIDRIDTLSMKTLIALNSVNDKINAITSTCIVDGRPKYNLLSPDLIQSLISLEEERSDLSNFYDADNQLKSGDDFIIANDLMMWNRKISGKINYITDQELYSKCKEEAKDLNSFERTFSTVKINPKIWDLIKLGKSTRIPQSDPLLLELTTLYYLKSKLVGRYKGEKIGLVKWDELFDEEKGRLKNIKFWQTLNYMDSRIADILTQLAEKYKTTKDDEDGFTFSMALKSSMIPYNYLRKLNVDWADPNEKSQYRVILDALTESMQNATTQEERDAIVAEAQLMSKFNAAIGRTVPADIFFAIRPIKDVVEYEGLIYNTLIRQPNSLFLVLDKDKSSSEYVNKQYKESKDGFVQPKENLYRDKRWDVIENNQDLLNLHTRLKEIMLESWKNLPITSKYDDRLSQMGGRTGEILGRNMKSQFGKNVAEFFRREFSVVETDLEFRPVEDREKRPDGSDIENIPIRFLRKLDNPEYISSDLIWSTICFYDMSLNFKTKMDHVAELTSIFRRLDLNQISDEYKSLFDARQAEVIKGMLDRQIYDKNITVAKSANLMLNLSTLSDENLVKKGPRWLKSAAGTSKDWLKRVGKLRISLLLGMLAMNLPSAIVSFLDPFLSLTVDCITGKYINAKDVAYALGLMIKDFPMAVFGMGSIKAYCKSVAAMQKFLLSRRVPETVRKSNATQMMKFLTDGPLMKGFTLGDYTMNTINLISTMHNYKYYKDNSGHASFMPKHLYIQKVMQDQNCNVKKARDIYDSAVNMYSCYKVDETGEFVIDLTGMHKEEARAITTDVELSVKKQTRSRSAIYNGLVPNTERTLLQTNVVLAFFSMLRNFLITGVWERFLTYRDFLVSTFDEYGNPVAREATREERADARKNQNYYKGGYSFATKQIENGVTWSALNALKHSLTSLKYAYLIAKVNTDKYKYSEAGQRLLRSNNINEQDAYGLQKVFLECLCWMSLLGLSSITSKAADDDKNNYIIQMLNLLTLRLSTERYTWYSPETAMELIKSPTTALSDWLRKMKIAALGEDLVTYASTISGLTDQGSYNDIIKRGYYKGSSRWKRDLYSVLSSTGIHNWHKSMPEILGGSGAQGLRETLNFYKRLRPDWYGWIEDKAFKDDDGNWEEW